MDATNLPEYAGASAAVQNARHRLTLATNARLRSEYLYLLGMHSVCQYIRDGMDGLISAGIQLPQYEKACQLMDRISNEDVLERYESWVRQSEQGQTAIFMPERLDRTAERHRIDNHALRQLVEREIIPELCTLKPIPAAAQAFNQQIMPLMDTLKTLTHYLQSAQKFYRGAPGRS